MIFANGENVKTPKSVSFESKKLIPLADDEIVDSYGLVRGFDLKWIYNDNCLTYGVCNGTLQRLWRPKTSSVYVKIEYLYNRFLLENY